MARELRRIFCLLLSLACIVASAHGAPQGAPGGLLERGIGARVAKRVAEHIVGPVKVHVDDTWYGDAGPVLVIELTPDSGWHLSWMNPGDAGQPPRVTLTLPEGWTQGEVRFATPSVIQEGAGVAFGYDKVCTLLVPIVSTLTALPGGASSPPQPLPHTVTVELSWLVCKEKCEKGQWKKTLAMATGTMPAPPLPAEMSQRFPLDAPASTAVSLEREAGGAAAAGGAASLVVSIPGAVGSAGDARGDRLVLSVGLGFEPATNGPYAPDAAGHFRIGGTLRPEDVGDGGLRLQGVLLRENGRACSLDFLVPREDLGENPAIARPVRTASADRPSSVTGD